MGLEFFEVLFLTWIKKLKSSNISQFMFIFETLKKLFQIIYPLTFANCVFDNFKRKKHQLKFNI